MTVVYEQSEDPVRRDDGDNDTVKLKWQSVPGQVRQRGAPQTTCLCLDILFLARVSSLCSRFRSP